MRELLHCILSITKLATTVSGCRPLLYRLLLWTKGTGRAGQVRNFFYYFKTFVNILKRKQNVHFFVSA